MRSSSIFKKMSLSLITQKKLRSSSIYQKIEIISHSQKIFTNQLRLSYIYKEMSSSYIYKENEEVFH